MDFKVTETNKGKKCLIHNGFSYRMDSILKDNDIAWRCTNSKCKGRLRSDRDITRIIPMCLDHCHENDEKKTERRQLRAQVKRKAVGDISARPSKIIRTELKSMNDQMLDSRDLKAVAQSLYRERRKGYPALPKNREDVHHALEEIQSSTVTNKGEHFILKNDLESGIVVLSCASNMRFLVNSAEELFVDGTFKCCPKYFHQMYTVHGLKNGHFVPLIYALLPDKRELTYKTLWTFIIDICSSMDLQLQPSVVHVDFEVAMHTVINELFPNSSIKCCRFHLGQAWYRKIQSLGLSEDYKDRESEIGTWLKLSFGLHFVDPSTVEDCFADVLIADLPADDRCIKFADYLLDNYITADSRYPPPMWAESPSHQKRTNNATESFHSHFNKQFYSSHPSIFVFLDIIQNIQTEAYIKIRSTRQATVSKLRKTDKERTDFAITQYQKFMDNSIALREYMRSVGLRFQARADI